MIAGTRKGAIVAATLAAALVMAACSSVTPGSDSENGNEVQGQQLTPAEVRGLGDVTLTMVDFETAGGGLGDALTALVDQFEADYPNVTVERSSKDFNSYGKTIKLTMSESDAPDIAEANVVMARTLIPAGLVRPLNNYYEEYNWTERYPPSVLGLLQSSPDGKTFGEGDYWGQALGGNLVGVYYNEGTLEELGLSVPSTFAEFEDALAVAKSNDVLPIQLGNLDQFPANHVLSTLMNATEDPDVIRDWINGEPGATYDTPGITEAAEILQDWYNQGYLPADANGIKYDDSISAFGKGEGLFYITGSWQVPNLSEALGENGGFFLLPPTVAGGEATATGWLANPYVISEKSENADLAAFFLDYMSGPEGSSTAIAGGFLPFGKDAASPDQSRVAAEVTSAWYSALEDDGLVPYLDFATPSMGDTMFPAIQSLLAGKTSPSEYAATVQADWDSYHS